MADLDIADSPHNRVAVALRFCLSLAAVATVIPGMLSPAEVLTNVAVCNEGALDGEAIRRIETIYRDFAGRLKA